MAKPIKIKNKNGTVSYRMFIKKKIDGVVFSDNKVFSTRQLAIDWRDKRLKEIESESIHGTSSNETISAILIRYKEAYEKNFGRSKNADVDRLIKTDLAKVKCSRLTTKHIIEHCTERNKIAKPQTVLNDVIWLRTALRTMSATEGFNYDPGVFERAMTVLKQEKLVARSTERTRRPTKQELYQLSRYFGKQKRGVPMLYIIWFAIFSARRQAEITRIEWTDNNKDNLTGLVRDAKHPTEKKGNHKRFKYTQSAWKIVEKQPKTSRYMFPYNSKTIGTYFRDACKILNIKDLHFHDLRHEATSRLFEAGYQIQQVQLFTLHEDWKNLQRYTNLKHEDID